MVELHRDRYAPRANSLRYEVFAGVRQLLNGFEWMLCCSWGGVRYLFRGDHQIIGAVREKTLPANEGLLLAKPALANPAVAVS